jgi:hypothetical protein
VQGLLPLIPVDVGGIALNAPITKWWTELHAEKGACGKCLLTVLHTLVEFMCLMTVPTIVGAVLVLIAAFAPDAAKLATKTMDDKVRAAVPPEAPRSGALLTTPLHRLRSPCFCRSALSPPRSRRPFRRP